jgi:hypothetical protein
VVDGRDSRNEVEVTVAEVVIKEVAVDQLGDKGHRKTKFAILTLTVTVLSKIDCEPFAAFNANPVAWGPFPGRSPALRRRQRIPDRDR